MKKLIALLLVLVFCFSLVSLISCGDDDTTTENAGGGDTTTTVVVENPDYTDNTANDNEVVF